MRDNNLALTVVVQANLGQMENLELASANNAINGFGRMSNTNKGYKYLFELGLIKEDGTSSFDPGILENALAAEVNRRYDSGTFK